MTDVGNARRVSARGRGALIAAGAVFIYASVGIGSAAALPDPCTAVPIADVISALGLKHAPSMTLAQVPNVSTCAFGGSKLTVSVGTTTIANPALPLKVVTIPGLPNGTYRTYPHSTQTEIVFIQGTIAAGNYGVIRNYVNIKKGKLVAIAKALYAAMNQQPGSTTQTTPAVHLVGGGG